MIFQLSDWFPNPMIWAIIIKFDQIRKNWWRISCPEILEGGKIFFAALSVKKMSRFEEVSPKEIKRIAWKFTKTVILLGLAGYELIITNEAVGRVGYIYITELVIYISSYPARPLRITVKYINICMYIYIYTCDRVANAVKTVLSTLLSVELWIRRRYNEETKFSVTPSFVLTHSSNSV